ncbi:neogenin-like isoform X2 [Ptychodera flava]
MVESSGVKGYEVFYKEAGGHIYFLEVVDDPNQTSLVLENLKPYTVYQISVAEIYSAGKGPTSDPVSIRTDEDVLTESPHPILNVLGSTSIEVSWQMVESSGVKGYEVFYKEAGGHMYFLEVVDDPNQTSLVLENLKPYTVYQISVAEIYSAGRGPNSVPVSIRTDEDVPSGPPIHIVISEVTSGSMTFTWEAPDEDKRNGIILWYDCVFLKNDVGYIETRTTGLTTVTFNNIESGTAYSFKSKHTQLKVLGLTARKSQE